MCGFVAIIRKKTLGVDRNLLKQMTDTIIHRGPDDEGFYCNEWLGLGFRRLSIIDLSATGHQPMLDASERYICVFNGEIFNYRELRQTLIQQGVTFKGSSDTEVLINAYIHWGADCVHKFIGMFAFIIADLKQKTVFIARDFPGIKPLYVTEDEHFYYFASEIKAFAKAVPLSANPECYFEHFNFRYLAGDKTHFRQVYKVLPGHYWTLNLQARDPIKKHAYFDLAKTFHPHQQHDTITNLVANTQHSLQDSFKLHTRSDVGYCIELSGGVDSSYLTSVLAKETSQTLHTFSIEIENQEFDESRYQRQVIERYHTQHHGILMRAAEYAEHLERATYHMESPIIHSGCVFIMMLCKHIQAVSKVVLTGEGADELFGGYWRHLPTRLQNAIFQLQKYGIKGGWLPNVSKFGTLKRLLKENLILYTHRLTEPSDFNQFFTCEAVPNLQRRAYANLITHDYVNATLAYDQLTYITSVLDRQDKLSMSHSVEARVPYCHQDLYKTINPVSNHLKIHNGERKAILKYCTKGNLSDELVYRRKNGLRLPLADWYRDKKLVGRYLDLLCDTTARQRGLYNQTFLDKAISEFVNGNDRFAKPIIMLVNLELWHRAFNL